MNDYIVQIRCDPARIDCDEVSRSVCDALAAHDGARVFFHGDGTGLARACLAEADRRGLAAGAEWSVCRTSWSRRFAGGPPDAPLGASGLVALFDGLSGATRVDSFGVGGSLCSRRPAGNPGADAAFAVLLEIGFAPTTGLQRTEALEMALAAAALEIDALVLFCAGGLEHLAGDAARGWRQITDFDLLELVAESDRRDRPFAVPARRVESAEAARLRARAATILLL